MPLIVATLWIFYPTTHNSSPSRLTKAIRDEHLHIQNWKIGLRAKFLEQMQALAELHLFFIKVTAVTVK